MKVLSLKSRSTQMLLFILLALGLAVFIVPRTEPYREWFFEGKARVREGKINPAVFSMSAVQTAHIALAGPNGFTSQTRLGFFMDNEWEPAIASDRFGHVYMLYPQYGGVPGCGNCSNPTMIIQISNDHGSSWGSPTIIYPTGAVTGGQWDAQLSVDRHYRR